MMMFIIELILQVIFQTELSLVGYAITITYLAEYATSQRGYAAIGGEYIIAVLIAIIIYFITGNLLQRLNRLQL